jgi:hypothetical protein
MIAVDTSALVASALDEKQADACIPVRRHGLLRVARKTKTAFPPATNQPDGQIKKSLSSPSRKNISLNPSGKSLV